MRLVCLIDSLGSGGAQRQICTLAAILKRRGVSVTMLTYYGGGFFEPLLTEAGVEQAALNESSPMRRLLAVRSFIRRHRPDVVLSFMNTCSMYAELAALPTRRWGLVASERGFEAMSGKWRRVLHRVADYVTTNSHTNRIALERQAPALAGRVVTIYNAVDLDRFKPSPFVDEPGNAMTVAVAASYRGIKNPFRTVEALALAREMSPSSRIRVEWYGSDTDGVDLEQVGSVRQATARLAEARGVAAQVCLAGPSERIEDAYQRAGAVGLFSLFEGMPNAVCEGMACGRPVLASDVSDAPNLVHEGENGYLCDPTEAASIARAMLRLEADGPEARSRMGVRGRELACAMFDPERVADHYMRVLEAAACRKRVRIGHWVPEVPPGAHDAARAEVHCSAVSGSGVGVRGGRRV